MFLLKTSHLGDMNYNDNWNRTVPLETLRNLCLIREMLSCE